MIAVALRRIAAFPWNVRILILAGVYAVCLGAAITWHQQGPALDSAEQLVWSYSLQFGYWKHPPVPSWIMHGLVSVFGPSLALPVFAAQACIAIALALSWRLGCEFMSPARSLAAAALAALIGYHGWGMQEFNHSSALLPFQAATVLAFWFALRGRTWRWWAVAGLCAGLGLMVKYVLLFPLAAIGLYVVVSREQHRWRTVLGIGLAAAVSLVVMAPHLLWLTHNDFMPLRYAGSVAVHAPTLGEWARNISEFAGKQLAQLLIFVAVLALALFPRRARAPRKDSMPQPTGDRLFLWVAGLLPLTILLTYSAVTRTELEPRWGSNMFLLTAWLVVDLLAPDPARDARLLRFAARGVLAICAAVGLMVPAAAWALGWQGRTYFPGGQLWELSRNAWAGVSARPLRLVVSDVWLGGSLTAAAHRPLAVLIDGEYGSAPWVRPGDVERCGALVLQDRSVPLQARNAEVSQMLDGAMVRGEWIFDWWPTHGVRPMSAGGRHIAWAVLPPRNWTSCAL